MGLISNQGEFGWMPTTCKTWRCKGCRDRMMSLFKARVTIGCSILGRCAFITGTYKVGDLTSRGARFVAEDWKELWRRMPKPLKHLEWLRVQELTQNGMPHWHLVAGRIPSEIEIRCWQGKVRGAVYLRRLLDGCECLAHRFSRVWYGVTGDSFMVHASPVAGGRDPGDYMGKYLDKSFDAERAKALGMRRRWSSSRGWPGSGRMRLEPTLEDDWKVVEYQKGRLEPALIERGSFKRVGTSPEMEALFEKKRMEQPMLRMRRLLHETDVCAS